MGEGEGREERGRNIRSIQSGCRVRCDHSSKAGLLQSIEQDYDTYCTVYCSYMKFEIRNTILYTPVFSFITLSYAGLSNIEYVLEICILHNLSQFN